MGFFLHLGAGLGLTTTQVSLKDACLIGFYVLVYAIAGLVQARLGMGPTPTPRPLVRALPILHPAFIQVGNVGRLADFSPFGLCVGRAFSRRLGLTPSGKRRPCASRASRISEGAS